MEANAEADRILEATRQSFVDVNVTAVGRSESAGGRSGVHGGGAAPTLRQAETDRADPVATAIVHLPTIGEVRPVNEGVELSVLNRGVLGHHPDTAEPGGIGNFAVAGHRTTYGRPLWDVASLRPGDPVVVETATDYYVYRLSELQVVQPDQTEVVAPVPGRPGAAPTGWLTAMYAVLWRVLPGPWWVRIAVLALLAAAVVVICFTVVFPEIAPLMPFNEGTVGAGPAVPAPAG